MADQRQRVQWGHTSSLMALIGNCHRDADAQVFKASDFDPFTESAKPIAVPFGMLMDVLAAGTKKRTDKRAGL